MKRLLLALGLGLVLAAPARAGWDEGADAFTRHDWPAAMRELKPLADGGDQRAQARVGHMLQGGLGVACNDAEAARLFKESSSEPIAQTGLATAYLFGRGVPKDTTQALLWMSRAADQDWPPAIHNMGEMYMNGIGVPKDEAKGVQFLQRGADKDFPASQDSLAQALWAGRGIEQDKARAVELARKASTALRPAAENLLGLAYFSGEGAPKDPAEAVGWFRRAAARGYVRAATNLGKAYGAGAGVAKDPKLSAFWHCVASNRAAETEKAALAKACDDASLQLPTDDAAKVREQARAWQPGAQPPADAPLPQPQAPVFAAPRVQSTPSAVSSAPSAAPRPTSGTGSGFFINRDGVVLTASHVVPSCRNIKVSQADGRQDSASVVARDSVNDLAALKTSARPAQVARFRDDKPIRPGDSVVAVGYPLSSLLSREPNVTAGVVSALAGLKGDPRTYQITAPVQRGNSGGPLADMAGTVVGIVSSKLNAMRVANATGDIPQNINFAIKSDLARKFLSDNGLAFETAPAPASLSAADVGERMRGVVVFVECEG